MNSTSRTECDKRRCDECGGEVVETAAGRECADCHKRFPPLRTDGGNSVDPVICPNCEEEVTLSYKCPTCGKPRPFGTEDDGAEDRRAG